VIKARAAVCFCVQFVMIARIEALIFHGHYSFRFSLNPKVEIFQVTQERLVLQQEQPAVCYI